MNPVFPKHNNGNDKHLNNKKKRNPSDNENESVGRPKHKRNGDSEYCEKSSHIDLREPKEEEKEYTPDVHVNRKKSSMNVSDKVKKNEEENVKKEEKGKTHYNENFNKIKNNTSSLIFLARLLEYISLCPLKVSCFGFLLADFLIIPSENLPSNSPPV